VVNGHFGEKFDWRADGWEVCLGGLWVLLVRKGVKRGCEGRRWRGTYLVRLLEGGHEACCVGFNLAIYVLTILVLLCVDGM
jgi:hypothetical protein